METHAACSPIIIPYLGFNQAILTRGNELSKKLNHKVTELILIFASLFLHGIVEGTYFELFYEDMGERKQVCE